MEIKDKALSRSERKKAELRKRIVETAIGMFNERSFHGVTMDEIACAVDIAKGTLYNHFPSKEEIVAEFIKNSFTIKHYERIMRFRELKGTGARAAHIFNELMRGVMRQKDLFEVFIIYRIKNIMSFNKPEGNESGIGLLAEEVVRLGKIDGDIGVDIADGFVKDLFEFTFIEIAKAFYNSGKKFRIAATVKEYAGVFARGIEAQRS